MSENVKNRLGKHITGRLLWEASPFMALLVVGISVFIMLFCFSEQLIEFSAEYPTISDIMLYIPMLLCLLFSWIINVKWLWKDRNEIKLLAKTSYDNKLVNLYTIASIFYVCVLFIPFALILRGSLRRIILDRIKPNTLSAFVNEKYLKGWE
ncbi:hypothetical protein HB981_00700 [Listeria seeligeri]|uniref:hypothetical protein n=1 Tax=Listeria seeligeri TaxID=1640 RepID=UPI0016240735|nr:hypothetical protein [Listeria seeligeri]MBC1725031.1 hypothetical protein [Listeria seeligeri]MBC1735628.1 hypothetical protein [Listeria seeligeri]MBC1738720.1 hypothetical protein [Listeria seeligeri]MBF2366689.1 hypothetical protein [Listeria seeligeri]MBF2384874.1 hypothetical protein [Listeria seeligeri]